MARILNRSLPDETDFERIDLPIDQWKEALPLKLGARRKMLLPQFFFNDVPELEELAGDYAISFVPSYPGSHIGKIYLVPK